MESNSLGIEAMIFFIRHKHGYIRFYDMSKSFKRGSTVLLLYVCMCACACACVCVCACAYMCMHVFHFPTCCIIVWVMLLTDM